MTTNYRIGNYVDTDPHGRAIIESISQWGAYVSNDIGGGFWTFDNIKSTPITKDDLLELGFEKNETDDGDIYYTYKFNDIIYCDLELISDLKNGFLEVCLFPYEEWFRWGSLHDVQNIINDLKQKSNGNAIK